MCEVQEQIIRNYVGDKRAAQEAAKQRSQLQLLRDDNKPERA